MFPCGDEGTPKFELLSGNYPAIPLALLAAKFSKIRSMGFSKIVGRRVGSRPIWACIKY